MSNAFERIVIAGDQSITTKGSGTMVGIPAVYALAANFIITSVRQFSEDRNAIIMFLQDGAIE